MNPKVLTVPFYDPGQDARIPLLKVPDDHQYTIERAFATTDRAVAASETDYLELKLQNGGTDQSGTDAISDTVGGTGGWAANTAKPITITEGSGLLEAGEWLMLDYNETLDEGDVAPGVISVTVEYVDGVGAKA